eukprot:14727542-Alexandrium_andersonii.AAC.1
MNAARLRDATGLVSKDTCTTNLRPQPVAPSIRAIAIAIARPAKHRRPASGQRGGMPRMMPRSLQELALRLLSRVRCGA